MKKTVLISGAAILTLAIVGYFLFVGSSSHKYDFRMDKVSKGDLSVYVTATGTINPVTSVDVGTQVSGIISKLYADYNSVVKKGQVIAQIDPTFLQQAVKDADAALDRAKAQAADSKRTFERTKALYDKGLESQADYDAALTTNEANKAASKQAVAALDRAKINLAYATIYAPIDGVVIDRKVNIGQTVAASFSSPTLYTIANDLSKMQVETTVDESDIGTVSIGQEATFTVDAYPDETFSGVVSQIRLAPVSIQNVVNYTVIIDVNNDRLKLMPGMTANVKLGVASAHDVLRVPNLALRFQPPPDLVDSSALKEMRESMGMRRGAGGTDSASRGSFAGGGSSGSQNRTAFGALRDSILAAHGGQLSRDEMREEMQKALGRLRATKRDQNAPPAPKMPTIRPTTSFGITQKFPQYEKSPYVPQHDARRGRVWVLNSQRKLEPVFIRTGISDGRFTEITSDSLKAGDEIVIGATSTAELEELRQTPLTGGQRGGRGFR
jgi:HlyD family secretion protein